MPYPECRPKVVSQQRHGTGGISEEDNENGQVCENHHCRSQTESVKCPRYLCYASANQEKLKLLNKSYHALKSKQMNTMSSLPA